MVYTPARQLDPGITLDNRPFCTFFCRRERVRGMLQAKTAQSLKDVRGRSGGQPQSRHCQIDRLAATCLHRRAGCARHYQVCLAGQASISLLLKGLGFGQASRASSLQRACSVLAAQETHGRAQDQLHQLRSRCLGGIHVSAGPHLLLWFVRGQSCGSQRSESGTLEAPAPG